MMNGSARHKVPGGKMLFVRLEYDSSIRSIDISGDFFIYPEEGVTLIERFLIGANPFNETELRERIAKVISSNNLELIGLTPESIAETINMVVR